MDLPSLRHFQEQKIFSDPVEALIGEAWVPAIYTNKGWMTADGGNMLGDVQEWRNGKEDDGSAKEGGQGDGRVQAGDTPKRQTRTRQGSKGQKPQAGNRNCPI